MIAVALSGSLCASCVLSSSPEGDEGFVAASDVPALAGCYANVGEGQGQHYLSQVIWPKEEIAHDRVRAIRVIFEAPRSVRVAALARGKIIKEAVFVEGRDFHLISGHIETKNDVTGSFAYPAGNVFIGVVSQSQLLGLDKTGNGRIQENSTFAGTAFLIVPVGGAVHDSFRFRRAPDLCNDS